MRMRWTRDKSRAALFARAQSIASAAITTLGAVLPATRAQLLPLREFGQIFFLVTLVFGIDAAHIVEADLIPSLRFRDRQFGEFLDVMHAHAS